MLEVCEREYRLVNEAETTGGDRIDGEKVPQESSFRANTIHPPLRQRAEDSDSSKLTGPCV